LDKYGLYYFDSVRFGVSATITSLVNECVFQTSNNESVTLGLDASAKSAGVSGQASFTQAEENAKDCLVGQTSATLTLLGGDFSQFNCYYDPNAAEFACNGTWNAYAATAIYDPWGLAYTLARISTLVANDTLRGNLDNAIVQYLQEVNATIGNVQPKPYTGGPCPCTAAATTATTSDSSDSIPISSSLAIGLIVGGIVVVAIIGVGVKHLLLNCKHPSA